MTTQPKHDDSPQIPTSMMEYSPPVDGNARMVEYPPDWQAWINAEEAAFRKSQRQRQSLTLGELVALVALLALWLAPVAIALWMVRR